MDMTVYLTANSDKAHEYFAQTKNYTVDINLEYGMNFDDVIDEIEYQLNDKGICLDYKVDFEIDNQIIHDVLCRVNEPVSSEYEPDLN